MRNKRPRRHIDVSPTTPTPAGGSTQNFVVLPASGQAERTFLQPWEKGFHPTQAAFERVVDPNGTMPAAVRRRLAAERLRAYLKQRSRAAVSLHMTYTEEEIWAFCLAGRRGLEARFLRQADPEGTLSERARQRRCRMIRREYFRDLGAAGNAKRWGKAG
jgi:hypothetical protein